MKNSIVERLKRLEQIAPDKLVILADFDGVEKECSVDDLETNPKAKFIKVLKGNCLEDVDEIINIIEAIANE